MDEFKVKTSLNQLEQEIKNLSNQQSELSLYEYESRFMDILRNAGKELLESSLGKVPKDRRKKKLVTQTGKIEVRTDHRYWEEVSGQKVSPKMKEIVSFLAKDQCFEEASETLEKLLGVRVDDNAVHRIAGQCGGLAEEILDGRCVEDSQESDNVMYVGMDGTMILKREEGWKEVKVARVFEAESIRYDETNLLSRSHIEQSEYLTHFGESKEFGDKLKRLLGIQKSRGPDLVFLVDGARWMKLWIDYHYPKATQILDYYHAVENLGKYAEMAIDDAGERNKWLQEAKTILLEQGGEKLLRTLEQTVRKKDKKTKAYDKLMVYLGNNIERMNYPEYDQRGMYIGSGSIESAHRTVVHKRLKLSGQRWTKSGADKIMSLRVLYLSNRWEELSARLSKRA